MAMQDKSCAASLAQIWLQLWLAFRLDLVGVLLVLVSATTVPLALLGLARGWAVVPVLERLAVERWALVLALVSLTVWVTRCVTLWLW